MCGARLQARPSSQVRCCCCITTPQPSGQETRLPKKQCAQLPIPNCGHWPAGTFHHSIRPCAHADRKKWVTIRRPLAGISGTVSLADTSHWGLSNCTIPTRRREDRLDALKAHIIATYPSAAIHVVVLDVRATEAVEALPATLPPEFAQVDILINNAGLALGVQPVQSSVIEVRSLSPAVSHSHRILNRAGAGCPHCLALTGDCDCSTTSVLNAGHQNHARGECPRRCRLHQDILHRHGQPKQARGMQGGRLYRKLPICLCPACACMQGGIP